MADTRTSRITRLSEAQARALADWWGGSLQKIFSPEQIGETRYGVVFPRCGREDLEMAVFSLEEAQSLENLRDVNNPNAPDWVG